MNLSKRRATKVTMKRKNRKMEHANQQTPIHITVTRSMSYLFDMLSSRLEIV